jgi:hypothetical protein
MTVATFQTAIDGVNPFVVEGPATLGSGVIVPQYRLGHVAYGDAESEWVYCKYTSVANQVLSPGLLFTVDDDYTATLLTTANSPRGSKVMVCGVGLGSAASPSRPSPAPSTTCGWLAPVRCPSPTPPWRPWAISRKPRRPAARRTSRTRLTTSSKLITGLYITKAVGGTFTGTTVNGSTQVTNLVGLTDRTAARRGSARPSPQPASRRLRRSPRSSTPAPRHQPDPVGRGDRLRHGDHHQLAGGAGPRPVAVHRQDQP